jgi:hypothetical protein
MDESVPSVRSYNFERGDISRAIVDKSEGKIAEVVAILHKEDDQEEPHVLAFIVVARGPGPKSPRYLQGMLRGLDLPAYMWPTRAIIRDSLLQTKDDVTDRGAVMMTNVPKSVVILVVQPASSFGRSQHPFRGGGLPSAEQNVLRM